jgi:hypothetical protein
MAEVVIAELQLKCWAKDALALPNAAESLRQRIGVPQIITCRTTAASQVPRGHIFLYFNPNVTGELILSHNVRDWEQVNTLMASNNQLVDMKSCQQIPNSPTQI